MSGGPAAGGHRDLWPAGPCSEVYHLGYDPPLQRAGALQQGSGTLTGRTADVSLLPTHNRMEEVNHHNRKQLIIFFFHFERKKSLTTHRRLDQYTKVIKVSCTF